MSADDADRVAQLEAELAAARRTIDVLMDRVEQPVLRGGADRFALLKTVAHLQDTVRHKHQAITRAAQHYRALYENSPDAVLTVDGEGAVSDCNVAAARLFGRSQAAIRGASLSALLDPASGAAMTTLLWSGFTGVGESEIGLSDGRRLSFSVAALDGRGWLVVFRDVTRSHELDQELMQARRLASVGRLASSVALEINTPLSVIQGRLQMLRTQAAQAGARAKRQIDVIEEQCLRIANLVLNLQTFAVQRKPNRSWLDVRTLAETAQAQVEARLRRVRVATPSVPDGLQVRGDAALLPQMLGGLLRDLGDRSPPGSELSLHAERQQGGVLFSVRGEAVSIDAASLGELRSSGAGRAVDPSLGFHLAIACAIAQDHGGSLIGESHEDGSAVFRVTIPDKGAEESRSQRGQRPLRILVVDDDQLLCESVEWMLSHDGHDITTTQSAEEALERLRVDTFDVVLTDYLLPGLNGEEFISAMAERWPGLASRTVLTSGLKLTPRSGAVYMQKPFTRSLLLEVLQELAGARRVR